MKARLALVWTLCAASTASAESAIDLFADGATTCVVRADHRLSCWGANRFGDPAVRESVAGVPVTILGIPPGVTDVAYSGVSTCALTSGGSVHCWGDWNPGYPSLEPGLEAGVRAIARACAVTGLGSVLCDPFDPPSPLAGLESGVADLADGGFHFCALISGGGVRCVGQNDRGQLGNGDVSWQEESAVDVVGLASGVLQVTAGYAHSCALKTSGEVWCWGEGDRAALGQPDQYDDSSVPLQVQGLPLNVVGIAATHNGSCALTSSGAVWCWGSDSPAWHETPEGVAGLTPTPIEGLTQDVVKIVAGWNHACALKSSGNVLCWGSNTDGQLGVARRVASPVPVSAVELPEGVAALDRGCMATVSGGEPWCPGMDPMPDPPLTPIVTSTSEDWLTSTGYVWTYDPDLYPHTIMLLGEVSVLEEGDSYHCALKTQGSVWCWGWNNGGRLGWDSGDWLYNPYPGQVTSVGTGVRALAVGSDHSCVITSGGGVRCWGENYYGQLGDGTTNNRLLSAPVSGLESGVAALSAAASHTCALTNAGGVWCWGNNQYGQLGDGTYTTRYQPVPVSGLSSGVAAITTSTHHTCALMLDGSMRCWGQNFYGQLGDGTFTARPAPVVVSGIAGGVHRIVLFDYYTCAVMTSGPAQCWGNDWNGELRDGGLLQSRTPLAVTSFGGAPEVPVLGAPWLLVLACGLAVAARRRLRAH